MLLKHTVRAIKCQNKAHMHHGESIENKVVCQAKDGERVILTRIQSELCYMIIIRITLDDRIDREKIVKHIF